MKPVLRLFLTVFVLTALFLALVFALDSISGENSAVERERRAQVARDAARAEQEGKIIDSQVYSYAPLPQTSLFSALASPLPAQAFANLGALGKTLSSALFAVLTATTLVVQLAVLRFTPLIVNRVSRSWIVVGALGECHFWTNWTISERLSGEKSGFGARLGVFLYFLYFLFWVISGIW
eukprot:TRINITY_DN7776_c0_g1_i2.p1 TRINITY_DN7776_c0_g1~~TRINITY_DN7776_c0_g1_i2.p1  ORF type:complete len:194 (+),score=30.49 TRINITY_DN7776_c0_g1_i2:45-584(+)